ncbi:hypothetical protein EYF80_019265 [Liparis tanakae]|uniref:Uncharacterized protein n=1 Tax=Liparis tanakae TaxID=230148 RepID=A0A4Z2HYC4_9TELE|nr:hypothetical protein EYF80_019265 [Liparis tanakae]
MAICASATGIGGLWAENCMANKQLGIAVLRLSVARHGCLPVVKQSLEKKTHKHPLKTGFSQRSST